MSKCQGVFTETFTISFSNAGKLKTHRNINFWLLKDGLKEIIYMQHLYRSS